MPAGVRVDEPVVVLVLNPTNGNTDKYIHFAARLLRFVDVTPRRQ